MSGLDTTDRRSGAEVVNPILECQSLCKSFGHGRHRHQVLRDVSFTVGVSETFGLVGESGSGKSTIARSILRFHPVDSGLIRFAGEDLTALSSRQLRRLRPRIQVVLQDPIGSLNRRHSVRQIVETPLIVAGVPKRERADEVDRLLDLVGLSGGYARRRPSELSGGQCQRVSIARAIASNPELIILDEAVSALDVSVRAQVLNLLRDLQRKLEMSYLFISHDLSVVKYMSDRLAVLQSGEIVEMGSTDAVFESPTVTYTRQLMAAIPTLPASAPRA